MQNLWQIRDKIRSIVNPDYFSNPIILRMTRYNPLPAAPDYLVHPLYFPEPESDALAWSNVSVGYSFSMIPRVFSDQWYVNLKSGAIWVNTSSTTYFA